MNKVLKSVINNGVTVYRDEFPIYTKTLDEQTWFEKFIRSNILDKEPVYEPYKNCNTKLSKPFEFKNQHKFIEYENLIGKQIKSINWVGDCWMRPSNKENCDLNHVFKIQCSDSNFYLFILRCSSDGGVDADLVLEYK